MGDFDGCRGKLRMPQGTKEASRNIDSCMQIRRRVWCLVHRLFMQQRMSELEVQERELAVML